MNQPEPPIRPRHDFSVAEIDALEDHLYAFNVEATGYHDGDGLGFAAEVDGEIVGAVAGYSWGGIAEFKQVWVHDRYRGQGLGRRLLLLALDEAERRGCAHVFLTTYDFQAPNFYRGLGFEEVARIEGKPLGHTEFVMKRVFRAGDL
jgi:ribosomal protein S18 acetylase RimI-like enzyme